jgi:hypothetical protein
MIEFLSYLFQVQLVEERHERDISQLHSIQPAPRPETLDGDTGSVFLEDASLEAKDRSIGWVSIHPKEV